MFTIFLTDRQQTVQFNDYPGDDPVKFMMNFKKIFPSTMDLLLPILPESSEALDQLTWESSCREFDIFQKLIQDWATVELRLTAMTKLKDRQFANQLVTQAQQTRKKFLQQQNTLNPLHADYIFLLTVHSLLDAELVEVGAQFYVPSLKDNWQTIVPKQVLNAKI